MKAFIDAPASATDTAIELRTAALLHARVGALRSHHPGCDHTSSSGKHTHSNPVPFYGGKAVGGSHDATRVRSVTIHYMVPEQSVDTKATTQTALHHSAVSQQLLRTISDFTLKFLKSFPMSRAATGRSAQTDLHATVVLTGDTDLNRTIGARVTMSVHRSESWWWKQRARSNGGESRPEIKDWRSRYARQTWDESLSRRDGTRTEYSECEP